jgi:quinoprotein glucose dehydrogenase
MRVVASATTLVALAVTAANAQQSPAMRTAKDGVFTAEQARRGRVLYEEHCSMCHGPTLGGVEMAPPLTGSEFYSNWGDLLVSDLFQRINQTMPQATPGSLSRRQNADIVAFILSFNKAPAGQVELPADADVLKTIRIVPTD